MRPVLYVSQQESVALEKAILVGRSASNRQKKIYKRKEMKVKIKVKPTVWKEKYSVNIFPLS
jgi:hypothetical protein